MARPAGVGPAPHARADRIGRQVGQPGGRSRRAPGAAAEGPERQQAAFGEAGLLRVRRHLHPPRLRADLPAGSEPLLLPVPRIQVRPRGTGLQGRSGAAQSRGAVVQVPLGKQDPHLRGRQRGLSQMAAVQPTTKTSGLLGWIDERFPLTKLWKEHVAEYYAPKNFNFWYYFGSLALVVLVMQILTGIFLTMHYKADAAEAFSSVEYVMREVPFGWLIRYMHSTGASAFFIVVYLHMFRAMMYGSYKKPRELLWIIGVLIYLSLMGEAFFGYLLPWGQMSFWGAQVIVNLFGSIPFIGPDLAI